MSKGDFGVKEGAKETTLSLPLIYGRIESIDPRGDFKPISNLRAKAVMSGRPLQHGIAIGQNGGGAGAFNRRQAKDPHQGSQSEFEPWSSRLS